MRGLWEPAKGKSLGWLNLSASAVGLWLDGFVPPRTSCFLSSACLPKAGPGKDQLDGRKEGAEFGNP